MPGRSLRLARSPVAPKRTMTWSVRTRSEAGSCCALIVVPLTHRRLQRAVRGPYGAAMPGAINGGAEFVPATLERTEARFWREIWDSVPAAVGVANGVRRAE